jgi:hypothetical protein
MKKIFLKLKILFIENISNKVISFKNSDDREPVQPQPQPQPDESSAQDCDSFNRHCDSLRCTYGILKSYDANSGCERCSCENPCDNYDCPSDSKCSVDVSNNEYGETVFVPICRQYNKPGQCPNQQQSSEQCDEECRDDADCRGDYKCCRSGCSNICTAPATHEDEEETYVPPYDQEAREPTLDDVSEEDLQPIAKEGGVATLRCFATGFPPPSITWKRGGIEVIKKQIFPKFKIQLILFIFIYKPAQHKSRTICAHFEGRLTNCAIASN